MILTSKRPERRRLLRAQRRYDINPTSAAAAAARHHAARQVKKEASK